MATVEELLVKIGVDPVSVNQFLQDINRVVDKAEDQEVNISVQTAAGRNLATVTASTAALGAAAQRTTTAFQQGLDQVKTSANELRTGLLALSAVAGIGLAGSIRAAQEESKNFAAANVILKLSNEDLGKAQEALRKVADDVGLTFQEVSAALFDVASAGFKGAEAIDITTVAARVAVPANTSVATAFNAIATAMKNFGFEAADAGDALVKVADLSRASLGGIADALGILGPIAGQAGISFAEIGGSLAQITEQGLSADLAATALQATLIAFISPSEKARRTFEKLGIATGDAAFRSQTLAEKIDLIKEAARTGGVEVSELFDNIRAFRGAAILIKNSDAVAQKVEEIGDAAGRTQEAIDSFFSQAGPQLDKLGASFINLVTIIGADLLDALLPTIKALEEFIRTNRDVITEIAKVVITVGLVVAGILLFVFAAKQAVAAVGLLVGGLNLLAGALTANTAATAANTAARASAISPELFQFFAIVRTFLTSETRSVIALARGYLVLAAARIKAIAGRFLQSLRELPFLFRRQTEALAANAFALNRNSVGLGALNAEAARLSPTLAKNIKNVSLLSNALGVLGAAVIGFQIGSFVDSFFGFSEAVRTAAKTSTQSAASIVGSLAALSLPVINVLFVIAQLENALEKANQQKLQPIEAAELKEDIVLLERFNRILNEGRDISERRAFLEAINDQARIVSLEKLEKQGQLNAAQAGDLAATRLRLAAATETVIQKEREVGEVSTVSADRRKKLEAAEKSLAKLRATIARDLITIRQGEAASEIDALQTSLDKRVEFLRKIGAIQIAEVRDTQEKIRKARAAEEVDQTGLRALLETLRQQRSDLARTLQDITDLFEIAQAKIIATGAKRVEELRRQGEQEIAIVRRTADATIREQRRIVTEAEREIANLRAVRDRGVADATSFLERLRDAAIRELDPALAQLRRFEKEAFQGLTGATAQQAAASIEFIRKQLEKLAGATQEEADAQRELKETTERLAAAEDEGAQVQLLEQQTALEEKLANLQARREIRAKAAQAAEQNLTEVAESAAARQLESQTKIEDQQAKIEAANLRIADVKTLLAAREKLIGVELEANIRRTQLLVQAELERARVQVEFSKLLAQGLVDTGSAETARRALEAATERVKTLQAETAITLDKQREAVGLLEQKAEDAFDALTRETDAQAERAKKAAEVTARLVPLADETARRVAAAQTAESEFVSSVDKILAASGELNTSFTAFASTVVTKNEEQAQVNSNTARQIADLQSQLAATQLSPADEQSGGGLD
ncbi:hypothetical protein LCGC14_0401660 [marine sediment metagenome]|uniref:Phage tail tape measure protein domain-containing protein n=1 Tax=marine sediment metagenome TaxID=412755 RepID=A0A0F9W5R7_9ZZZZ